jgi:hypothetical protein
MEWCNWNVLKDEKQKKIHPNILGEKVLFLRKKNKSAYSSLD